MRKCGAFWFLRARCLFSFGCLLNLLLFRHHDAALPSMRCLRYLQGLVTRTGQAGGQQTLWHPFSMRVQPPACGLFSRPFRWLHAPGADEQAGLPSRRRLHRAHCRTYHCLRAAAHTLPHHRRTMGHFPYRRLTPDVLKRLTAATAGVTLRLRTPSRILRFCSAPRMIRRNFPWAFSPASAWTVL